MEHLAQYPSQGLHYVSVVVILLENLGSNSLYSLASGNRQQLISGEVLSHTACGMQGQLLSLL